MRQRGRDAEVHRWSSLNFLSLHPSSPPDSPSSKTTRYQNHQPRPAVKTIVFLSCDHKFHCCHHVRVLPVQISGFLGLPLSFQSFMSSVPALVVYDLMPMVRSAVVEHAVTGTSYYPLIFPLHRMKMYSFSLSFWQHHLLILRVCLGQY